VEIGIDVFRVLEKGTRRESHIDPGEMLIRAYEADSRMPRDAFDASCYTVAEVAGAVVAADVVGQDTGSQRLVRGIVVVEMHSAGDRRSRATIPGYQDA
jgi:hypothetical protein